ncbi:MAG: hypothetical protein L0H55_14530, partial [Candidatus Nitrosocosmicus sp.]|nr:hypothetical protein [Candidatus Nitrosocosmicus sp.]
MSDTSEEGKIESWYNDIMPKYRELKHEVKLKVKDLLSQWQDENVLDVYDFRCRLKSYSSLREKVNRKSYQDLEQIEDILGCRIICYTKLDVEKACSLIEEEFEVITKDDKSAKLNEDQFGYQSMHFILKLKSQEDNSPQNLKFELQVRTIFQDAWANLSHKKDYKFSGYIPEYIKRKIYLYSGTLELLDDDLNVFTQELKNHYDTIPTLFAQIHKIQPSLAEYIYTQKIKFDLRIENYTASELQNQIFGSSVNIHSVKENVELNNLIKNFLNQNHDLFNAARTNLQYDETTTSKIRIFLENNIRAIFRQNDKIVFEPKLSGYGSVWNEWIDTYPNTSKVNELKIDKESDLTLQSVVNGFVRMSFNRATLENNSDKGLTFTLGYDVDVPANTIRLNKIP